MVERRHWLGRAPRTVLEQMIRERRETFEEFAAYAERFARDSGEPGTLSVRHLQRLVAGHRSDGTPLGPVRPATARLLEHIFNASIDDLLSPPVSRSHTMDHTHFAPVAVYPMTVAVAVVVKNSSVLAVCRRMPNNDGISWQFPAGIVKPGVSIESVARQETLNETGVHCSVKRRIGDRVHPLTRVHCQYLLCCYLVGTAANLDTAENVDVSWIDKAALTQFISIDQIFPPVLATLQL